VPRPTRRACVAHVFLCRQQQDGRFDGDKKHLLDEILEQIITLKQLQ
jgi:hypothetical protein